MRRAAGLPNAVVAGYDRIEYGFGFFARRGWVARPDAWRGSDSRDHRRRIEQASQRRNDLIEQILRQAETRNLSDRERQLLEQLHGDKPA